jgi:hypothetical protein
MKSLKSVQKKPKKFTYGVVNSPPTNAHFEAFAILMVSSTHR